MVASADGLSEVRVEDIPLCVYKQGRRSPGKIPCTFSENGSYTAVPIPQ